MKSSRHNLLTMSIILIASVFLFSLVVLAVLLGTHTICFFHFYQDATCTQPKTCKLCGATTGEPLGHRLQDATCEAPSYCLTCGETVGEALGHTPGTEQIFSDVVKGYYQVTYYCTTCNTELESTEYDYTTFISGETFLFTPEEFSERLENGMQSIYGCYLTTELRYIEDELYIIVLDTGSNLVYLGQFHGVGEDNILYRKDSTGASQLTGLFSDDDSVSEVLLGIIQALDPSLSFDEAKELALSVTAASRKDNFYSKNGILYKLYYTKRGWFLAIQIDTE